VSLLRLLSDIGESVPGWTVVALVGILIALMIGGRVLDMLETTTAGVESKVRSVNVSGVGALGDYMPDYGYRALARGVWAAVTGALAMLVTLFWVGKAVNALRRGGEEL
jgi:hypothetical protein